MFAVILYVFVIFMVALSFIKDKNRTLNTLKRVNKSINDMLPQCIMVLMIAMPLLAVFDKDVILNTMGNESGLIGILFAGIIGSIAYIPAIIAFPLSLQLLNVGAGYGQITMFATTLTMVGLVTLPIEFKYFGKKLALKRILYGFMHAFIISYVISIFFK